MTAVDLLIGNKLVNNRRNAENVKFIRVRGMCKLRLLN
jgi:hypothetical protein